MRKHRSTIPFEIKALSDKGAFSGYGSTFGNIDFGGDIAVAGCFAASLAEHKAKGELPAMLYGHNMDNPCGVFTKMEEDAVGLFVEGQLWLGTDELPPDPNAVKAYRTLKGNAKKGLSIGYITRKYSRDERTSIRSLLQVDLLEVSHTIFPMNPEATVTGVKSALVGPDGCLLDPRAVERLLRDELGLSAREAKAFMAEGYKALTRDADGDTEVKLSGLDAITKAIGRLP